uniref:Uncharacterized protein n=1 Tax=Mola mola TaxID=94237 RepID=A0A3Q3WKR9_MOLML
WPKKRRRSCAAREEGRRMATVQCPKCTAERKGFRRELDSWRHKLIHCVGFESILEGIYGQMLLSDLQLFYVIYLISLNLNLTEIDTIST